MLVPIIRQPACPQRQSRPGISSAFQAQITQANPFLQHWLMTEEGCSLLIGRWRLQSIILNKEEAEREVVVVVGSAACEQPVPAVAVCIPCMDVCVEAISSPKHPSAKTDV